MTEKVQIFSASLTFYRIIFLQKKKFKHTFILNELLYKNTEFKNILFIIGYEMSFEKKKRRLFNKNKNIDLKKEKIIRKIKIKIQYKKFVILIHDN